MRYLTTFRSYLVWPVSTLSLCGCTIASTTGVGSDEGWIEAFAFAYTAAILATDESDQTATLPTSGTATYTGGMYLDMTRPGAKDHDLMLASMTLEAAFSASSGTITGRVENAGRIPVYDPKFAGFESLLTDRTLTPEEAKTTAVEATNADALAILNGALEIAETTITDQHINTRLSGNLTGDDTDIDIDAPIYGFLTGADADGVRITGTNFGNIEMTLNGDKIDAYLNGYAKRD